MSGTGEEGRHFAYALLGHVEQLIQKLNEGNHAQARMLAELGRLNNNLEGTNRMMEHLIQGGAFSPERAAAESVTKDIFSRILDGAGFSRPQWDQEP